MKGGCCDRGVRQQALLTSPASALKRCCMRPCALFCSCGGVWPRPTAGAAGGPARQQSEDSEDGWDDDEEEGAGGAGGSGGKAAAEQVRRAA